MTHSIQKNPYVAIDSFKIGPGQKPFIAAEVGINHNGELEKALAMIDTAKAAGVDAVKFQTFTASEFVNDASQTFTYKSQGKTITEPMIEMFQRNELKRGDWTIIKKKCEDSGLIFLSTPQNYSNLELLLELGVSAVKVGSDDFTNLPLLKSYAGSGLPLILSCGMSDLGECHSSLEAVGALDGYPTILLLCTSQYPTPPKDVNLNKLHTLAKAFPSIPIGFSDHTEGPIASIAAHALGACFFEKHFTLDRNLPGPDHWFSEDPEGLATWANSIRTAYEMKGSSLVRPTAEEKRNRLEFRRYIVAARAIKSGEPFTTENLTMRRIAGGHGLPAHLFEYLLATTSHQDFNSGDAIEL